MSREDLIISLTVCILLPPPFAHTFRYGHALTHFILCDYSSFRFLLKHTFLIQAWMTWTGEVAQTVMALASKPNDLNLILRTHIMEGES